MPRDLEPPFKFDLSGLLKRFRKLPVSVEGITISLPFLEMTVKPDDTESKVAKEVVIRLSDRRVLNAFECCDGCIKNALKSLREIRAILVDKQVQLSGKADGPLYLFLDSIREGIRQFQTFEQKLKKEKHGRERERIYFAALEMLRAHIHRSLVQISKLADMEIPVITEHMRYDERWQIEAYKALPAPRE
jgi:hypothetical protein